MVGGWDDRFLQIFDEDVKVCAGHRTSDYTSDISFQMVLNVVI